MKSSKILIKQKHIAIGIIILLFLVSFFLVRNLITGIISAYVLAFMSLPLFRYLKKKIPKGLSAFICVILLLLIITVPLIFISTRIINEAIHFLRNIDFSSLNLPFSIEQLRANIINLISSSSSGFFNSLPSVILTFLVTFFGMFYFLYSWEFFEKKLYELIPFSNKKKMLEEISKTSKAILYGLLIIGLVEFIIAFVGFSISGVTFPLLFASVIGFLAFTLILDPSIIWGPLALFYFFLLKDIPTGIGIVITGTILSTDAILRPKILGNASKINPFVMMVGVLGGLSLFGMLGFIIGPIILITLLKLLETNVEIKQRQK
jgi:predicted PurR-regulated permease PerM